MANRFGRIWRGYVYGQLINSLITGFFVFLALWAVGLPGALLMGVIMMIFNMVPTFGPIIAAIPGILAALVRWFDPLGYPERRVRVDRRGDLCGRRPGAGKRHRPQGHGGSGAPLSGRGLDLARGWLPDRRAHRNLAGGADRGHRQGGLLVSLQQAPGSRPVRRGPCPAEAHFRLAAGAGNGEERSNIRSDALGPGSCEPGPSLVSTRRAVVPLLLVTSRIARQPGRRYRRVVRRCFRRRHPHRWCCGSRTSNRRAEAARPSRSCRRSSHRRTRCPTGSPR